MLTATNIVVDDGEDYNSHKYDRRPVKIRRVCWRSLGPETPEHYEDGVDNGSNVDRETPLAKTPSCCRKVSVVPLDWGSDHSPGGNALGLVMRVQIRDPKEKT